MKERFLQDKIKYYRKPAFFMESPIQRYHQGTCVISGLFNLLPIKISAINGSLKMDEQTALRNSPVHLLPATTCPLSILVGSDETSEFLAQSNELYTCWKESIPAEIVQAPGLNHYSILETILNPQSCLRQAMHRIMKI